MRDLVIIILEEWERSPREVVRHFTPPSTAASMHGSRLSMSSVANIIDPVNLTLGMPREEDDVMATNGSILVGTVGQGVLVSPDAGERWNRVSLSQGMHSDCIVRDLISDPRKPEVVYAGTDMGLYRTDDAGARWKLLDTPMRGSVVWALTIDSADPDIMYAGTGTPSTPGFYRSGDSGKTWEHRPMEIAEHCINVDIPRFTGIAIDPTDRRKLWAGIEVDGQRCSTDGGDTWTKVNGQIVNRDVHDVLVTAGPPKTVFILVNDEVWTSTDDGVTWKAIGIRQVFPWGYPRTIAVKPDDPKVLYLTIGDATPGRTGTIMRSKDTGKTWESLPMGAQPNSAMWTVSIQPADPNVVFAASRYGYLYRSDDGGDSWVKLWREFSEVSSVTWVPE